MANPIEFGPLPPRFAELKKELELQGRKYAAEAITFRDKIAELALGFIKDDSVVSTLTNAHLAAADPLVRVDPHSLPLPCCSQGIAPCP